MRILFAGTPEFAAGHLRSLLDQQEHTVVTVFTQPDRPAGRGKKLTPGPVKALALSHSLPLHQPLSLRNNPEIQNQITQLAPDIMIVVAYGLILPESILNIPRFGCLNVHASLLPRWRGAAPIQRAIEAGDTQTGITIMQMNAGLDTGDMLLKISCAIDTQDTTATLHDKLLALGGPALQTVLQKIHAATIQPQKQNDEDACYAAKITKAETRLDWTLPAVVLERKIRAFNPVPAVYFDLEGNSIRVLESAVIEKSSTTAPGTIVACSQDGIDIATATNILRLQKLQLPGKKIMTAGEIFNGHRKIFSPGYFLGLNSGGN